eukprot:8183408-Pyramimonas_sp.AAC.1
MLHTPGRELRAALELDVEALVSGITLHIPLVVIEVEARDPRHKSFTDERLGGLLLAANDDDRDIDGP